MLLVVYLLLLVHLCTGALSPRQADEKEGWLEGSPEHSCRRECISGQEPLTCRYVFTVEMYSSMSKACYDCPGNVTDCSRTDCIPADGQQKVVIVANRQLPGPLIEVCKGDRVLVEVRNGLTTETTTLHWHGIRQIGSPFMDGVPYVSQCPILPGETFHYDFIVDRAGTYLWHSHSGDQRADGLFGGLIVRAPRGEEHPGVGMLYDEDEHVIVINEWASSSASHSYVLEHQNGKSEQPHTILVNGIGRFATDSLSADKSSHMPLATFTVDKGKRYRFRVINVGADDCPIHVSVDEHPLLVISADGAPVEPIEVDSIRILSGERYDFVLEANRSVDNYWIRFQGDILCSAFNCHQFSILHYKGAPESEPSGQIWQNILDKNVIDRTEPLRELNPFDKGTETPGAICIPTLNSLDSRDPEITLTEPNHQFYISFDFNALNHDDYHRKNLYEYNQVDQKMRHKTVQLNHKTFRPTNFPLQTQPELISPEQFCNESVVDECTHEFCACTQLLKVKLNSVVELILVDEAEGIHLNHPMHLHGYYYRVVAMEKLTNGKLSVETVKQLDREGKIHRKLDAAPLKDTVIVPSGGYTVIRFLANNPGYWFFHCHFDKHSSNGMALVFKVGEHADFPKVPKNFPKCGNL